MPIVSSVMSRTCFKKIQQNFHLMGNARLQPGDKLGKIQPVYDELLSKLQQFGVLHQLLSIDESIVPYYEHDSCMMFIKGKPIQFRFKLWISL